MQTGSDQRPFSPLNSPNNHDTNNLTNSNGENISNDVVTGSEDNKSEDGVLQTFSPIIRPVSQLQQRFTHYTYEIDLYTSYLCVFILLL